MSATHRNDTFMLHSCFDIFKYVLSRVLSHISHNLEYTFYWDIFVLQQLYIDTQVLVYAITLPV